MQTLNPGRPIAQPHTPRARPDARPMRLALGATGIAAMSALATAIVLPPQLNVFAAPNQQQVNPGQQATDQLSPDPAQAQASVIYIQLQPGQTAPAGAMVIDASSTPASSSVATKASGGGTGAGTGTGTVTKTAPPVAQVTAQPTPVPTPKPTPTPIKTTQSGKVIP
ncbi:MAG TPA: hypothetical protein VF337_01215 [Candidatus Limnocylindrales bacterium]